MDISKYINNIFDGLNNTVLKITIEDFFFSSDNIEHFKKDKKEKKDKKKKADEDEDGEGAKEDKKDKKGKASKSKPKVYHHKAGSDKSKYTEDFKSDKKDKKDKKKKKDEEDTDDSKEKKKDKKAKSKPKVYHHKAGSDKSKYTEDFTNSENKLYIMLPKNTSNNSIDIWLPKF